MKRIIKIGLYVSLVVGLCLTYAVAFHTERTVLNLLELAGQKPPLENSFQINDSWTKFDDYYYYKAIDPTTFAILEPRYYQRNVSYLLVGDSKAILFDTGPGIRNIRPLIDSLTSLPILVVVSHFHYDHVGNLENFSELALPDLPELRKQFGGDKSQLTADQHLGAMEKTLSPTIKASTWLSDREHIDLGNRSLEVIYAPGHTSESIVLFDKANKQLFSGDFLYPGLLIGFGPRAHQGAYLRSATNLLNYLPADVTIFGGHAEESPIYNMTSTYEHLSSLVDSLNKIKNGKGVSHLYPLVYEVQENRLLLMPLPWNMRW